MDSGANDEAVVWKAYPNQNRPTYNSRSILEKAGEFYYLAIVVSGCST